MISNEIYYIGRAQAEWAIKCPLYLNRISAGFPFPTEEEREPSFLDLNELMIKNSEATFFLKVKTYAMENIGIFYEDTIVVDRSVAVRTGNIVIGFFQGVFVIRRLVQRGEKLILQSENKHYPPIEVKVEDFEIWGTVTFVIHKL